MMMLERMLDERHGAPDMMRFFFFAAALNHEKDANPFACLLLPLIVTTIDDFVCHTMFNI